MRWFTVFLLLPLVAACSSSDDSGGENKEKDKGAAKQSSPAGKMAQNQSPAETQPKETQPKVVQATPIIPAEALAGTDAPSADKKPAEIKDVAEEELPERAESADKQYEAIMAKYNKAMADFRAAYRQAATATAKSKVMRERYPNANDFAGEMIELATTFPESETAPQALMWVVLQTRNSDLAKKAQSQLLQNHIDSEALADVASRAMYNPPSPDNEALFQTLISESPHQRVKGIAAFARANYLNRGLQTVARFADDADRLADFLSGAGTELVALHETGKTTDGHTIESLFEDVIDNYGDVVLFERGETVVKVGPRAEGALFELRYLAIGKAAPDIEGEDIDGTEFKLSDYRGKVVMLDFWGDW